MGRLRAVIPRLTPTGGSWLKILNLRYFRDGGDRGGCGDRWYSGDVRNRGQLSMLDALIDLLTVHLNLLRCINAQADLIAPDSKDGDPDVVTNTDCFVDAAAQYQHDNSLFLLKTVRLHSSKSRGRRDWTIV